MVVGKETVFGNIDEALAYVLKLENEELNRTRKTVSPIVVDQSSSTLIPVDSLSYPQTTWFNVAPDDSFVMTRLNSGRFSLKPNLRNRQFLFRGESEFHSPSYPSLFRKKNATRYASELILGQEMSLLMMSHPLVELLDTGVNLCGNVYRFKMNLFGLTQHYYNKTSFFDLTSNPYVAAFFATNEYDEKLDTYLPIIDENHDYGVLYYYSLDINEDFKITFQGKESPLSTIGLQVFPRSGNQSGFLYRLEKEEDFNKIERLHAVRFKHNAQIAERICKQFNHGKDLFPDDILSNHWRQNHTNRRVLSERSLRFNQIIFNPKEDINAIRQELITQGFSFQDYKPSFTPEEMDCYYNEVKNNRLWERFCNTIYIPGDKGGKMKQELLSLPQNPNYRWAFERDESHIPNYDNGFLYRMYKDILI